MRGASRLSVGLRLSGAWRDAAFALRVISPIRWARQGTQDEYRKRALSRGVGFLLCPMGARPVYENESRRRSPFGMTNEGVL